MMNQRALMTSVLAGAVFAAGSAAQAAERDQLRIVGSSTVYPFASYVAEELGATTGHPTPVIESTGSGGGLKIFCEGDDLDTPDITNASRRMKPSEFERCADNGVTDITEFVIGADGIVIAQTTENAALNLSREQLTLAVAAKVSQDGELVDNPYENWNEIDSSLPDREITVYGPPSTSGTRDAFEELVLEAATEGMDGYDGAYSTVRDDGPYVDSGENDNLIVQKIQNDTEAVGIFEFSGREHRRDRSGDDRWRRTDAGGDLGRGIPGFAQSVFLHEEQSLRPCCRDGGLRRHVPRRTDDRQAGSVEGRRPDPAAAGDA